MQVTARAVLDRIHRMRVFFLSCRLSLNQSVMLLRHLQCAFVTHAWRLPLLYGDPVLTDTHKEFIFKKSRKSNYFLLTYKNGRKAMDNSKALNSNPRKIAQNRDYLKDTQNSVSEKVHVSEDRDIGGGRQCSRVARRWTSASLRLRRLRS